MSEHAKNRTVTAEAEPLIFELSRPGRRAFRFPPCDIPQEFTPDPLPESCRRVEIPQLPETAEITVIRHYNQLARKSFGVDLGFYPLGSCTMKYNPKVNDAVAALENFTELHPLQDEDTVQGALRVMHELLQYLCEITGLKWGTLQPFARAHGEYTGMKLFKAYFTHRGERERSNLIIPSSSHGTNPASAHIAGFNVIEIPADERGMVDPEDLKPYLNEKLAGIMLTNPSTLGLFEKDILKISHMIHQAGGLLYYDGANMNAIMGKVRPGDMGFDVVHLNLHKTFSTPHGGGGPGAGPVLVSQRLLPHLPVPDIHLDESGVYRYDWDKPQTIGRIAGFNGNFGVLLRAYTYIRVMGRDGLTKASETAVLNANYLRTRLRDRYEVMYPGICKHEFVVSASRIKEETGISAMDIAKGLLDYGIHPPTMYFPLIVPEALMIEPTETETRETLDHFCDVMLSLAETAYEDPQKLHDAPVTTPVRRVDEVTAARKPIVRYRTE
jgi:glycine dehydrogenase subunit 2